MSDTKCPAGPDSVASIPVTGTYSGTNFVAVVGYPLSHGVVANAQIEDPASSTPHIS